MAKKESGDKAVLLNRHNLQVAKFCATEEGSSAALKSVYVEPDGTTACNGHIVVHVSMPKIEPSLFPTLAEAPDMKHDAKPFLLSRDSALEIASNIPEDTDIPALRHAAIAVNNKRVRAATTDLAIESVVAEAQILSEYPKWRALKPKGAPTLELVLDARYLADLAAAAVKFQKGSPAPFIRIRAWSEPKTPVYLEACRNVEGQTWKAFVMQCRVSETSFGEDE
jgi:hypothetical protein